MPDASVVVADSLEELAATTRADATGRENTIADSNASIDRSAPLDIAPLDRRAARVAPPKSNWEIPLEPPPYYGIPVTCGITFTFGGGERTPTGGC